MAKDDLIYRETARRIIDSPRNKEQMLTMINSIPQVDVKPIVYGNWVPIDDEPHEDFECDRCGYIICGEEFATNFCPNCGADMRWKNEEEDSGKTTINHKCNNL